MSCLVSNWFHGFLLALGSVVACSLTTDSVCAGQRGRPIQISASQGEVTSTNVNQLRTKQLREELLKQQLKEDWIGFLDIFGSRGSLSGVAPPPIRPPAAPPAQNKQIKRLLEREKNWAFMTTDDLKEEQTVEEIFKLRHYDHGGQQHKELSSPGRYYESLGRDRFGGTNRLGERFAGSFDARKDDAFSALDNATLLGTPLFQTENKLKDLFDYNAGQTSFLRRNSAGIFSDLFGAAELWQTERTPAQKALLDEFKQLLETRSPLAAPVAAAGAFSVQADLTRSMSVLGVQPRPTVEPLFGSINAGTGARPAALPDLNAKAPGQSSLAPTLPAEAARPPSATLTFPKRKF
jgi:hypothetical protein